MENKAKSKRGGYREGAGRKVSAGGRKTDRAVTLDDETVGVLSGYGGDNLSEGIRRSAVLVRANSLDDETIDILTEYGSGDLSEGIRRAAELVNIHLLVG